MAKRQEPKADSSSNRVNFDNMREDKFDKEYTKRGKSSGRSGKSRSSSSSRNKSNSRSRGTSSSRDNQPTSTTYLSPGTKNPELLKAAGSVFFSTPLGARLPFTNTASAPGIMTFVYNPNYTGGENMQALNQVKDSVNSFTTHANSRNTSYNSAEQFMMITAGVEVFAAIALGQKLYGIMRNVNGSDEYKPRALVESMGFDYSDLQRNLSNMWFDLNDLIINSRQIWIPKDFPILKRRILLAGSVFTDGTTVKSQTYHFVPNYFLTYFDRSWEGGTVLGPAVYNTGTSQSTFTLDEAIHSNWNYSWSYFVSTVRGMIQNLMDSTYRGVIFGDILKAYGAENIFVMPEITTDYNIVPVYDQTVLSMIENSTILGNGTVNSLGYQYLTEDINSNTLVTAWQLPAGTSTSNAVTDWNKRFAWARHDSDKVLNFHNIAQPTPEEIATATSMTVGAMVQSAYWSVRVDKTPSENNAAGDGIYPSLTISYQTGTPIWLPDTCGSEIICDLAIFSYSNKGYPNLIVTYGTSFIPYAAAGLAQEWFPYVARASAFDWAPWVYVSGQETGAAKSYAMGDFDNYQIITGIELRKLNTARWYDYYGIPQL